MDVSDSLRVQSKFLLESVMGISLKPLSDLDSVLDALAESEVLLTLKWGGESHQLVAKEAAQDRVFMFNPKADTTLEVGTAVGGQDGIPLRRAEGGGIESMHLDELEDLLRDGLAQVDEIVPAP